MDSFAGRTVPEWLAMAAELETLKDELSTAKYVGNEVMMRNAKLTGEVMALKERMREVDADRVNVILQFPEDTPPPSPLDPPPSLPTRARTPDGKWFWIKRKKGGTE